MSVQKKDPYHRDARLKVTKSLHINLYINFYVSELSNSGNEQLPQIASPCTALAFGQLIPIMMFLNLLLIFCF